MIEITQRGEKQAETRAVFVSVSQGVKQKLTAVFERCEEGGFHAFIKEIAGVHSEGETIREATDTLMDALHEGAVAGLSGFVTELVLLTGKKRRRNPDTNRT